MSKPIHRIRGFTLVSIMVGLLISMLVVIGMLGLYRGVLRNVFGDGGSTPGIVPNAKQDGMLASGLMSAQVTLQEAGFGIAHVPIDQAFAALTSTSFDPVSGKLQGTLQPLTATPATVEAVVWETNSSLVADTNAWACSALWSGRSAKGQPVLYVLRSAGPCHPIATRFAELKWSFDVLIPENVLSQSIGLTARNDAACWPFGAVPASMSGLAPSEGALQVGLTYRNSTTGTASVAPDRNLTVCLPNFKAS